MGLLKWYKRKFVYGEDLHLGENRIKLFDVDRSFITACLTLGYSEEPYRYYDESVIKQYPENEYSFFKLKYSLHETNHLAIFAGILISRLNYDNYQTVIKFFNLIDGKEGKLAIEICDRANISARNHSNEFIARNTGRDGNWLYMSGFSGKCLFNSFLFRSRIFWAEWEERQYYAELERMRREKQRRAYEYERRKRQAEEARRRKAKHERSPYSVLGIAEGTKDIVVIKKAYRKLAMIHHPDRGGSAEMFARITEAYQAILNGL